MKWPRVEEATWLSDSSLRALCPKPTRQHRKYGAFHSSVASVFPPLKSEVPRLVSPWVTCANGPLSRNFGALSIFLAAPHLGMAVEDSWLLFYVLRQWLRALVDVSTVSHVESDHIHRGLRASRSSWHRCRRARVLQRDAQLEVPAGPTRQNHHPRRPPHPRGRLV